jgi:hypothetical protein
MTKVQIIKDLLILVLLVFYLIVTIRYFFVFKKSILFTGRIKIFHLVMIWLIPFIWIFILKSLTKPTPGSYELKKTSPPKPFSDNNDDAIHASNMGF